MGYSMEDETSFMVAFDNEYRFITSGPKKSYATMY